MVAKVQATFMKKKVIARFDAIRRLRKDPRISETIRDLALERLDQIERFGDKIQLVPSPHPTSNVHTPPERFGAEGVSSPPPPMSHTAAGD